MTLVIRDLMFRLFRIDDRAGHDVSQHRLFTTRYEDLCM